MTELIASNYDSCASQYFETDIDNCVPNSYVEFTDKTAPVVNTVDGGNKASGMALRRYHLRMPITAEHRAIREQRRRESLGIQSHGVL